MKKFFLVFWSFGFGTVALITAAIFYAVASFSAEKSEWYICAANSDCVIFKNHCTLRAHNESFKKEVKTYFDQQDSMAKCKRAFWGEYESLCQDSKCVAVKKK